MMGRTHALSAAVVWAGGAAAVGAPGAVVAFGSAVSAGYALLPDVDHPKSTVAHTLGTLSRLVAAGVEGGSARVRKATCGHCRLDEAGGHRTLTHTAVAAVTVGGTVAVLALVSRTAGIAAAAFGIWLGLHVALSATNRAKVGEFLLPKRRGRSARWVWRLRGRVGAVLLAAIIGGAAASAIPGGWWWVGVAAGWGMLAHIFGDACTIWGVPLWWPLRIRSCRWTCVGLPRRARLRTGGVGELVVFWALLLGGAGGLALYAAGAG